MLRERGDDMDYVWEGDVPGVGRGRVRASADGDLFVELLRSERDWFEAMGCENTIKEEALRSMLARAAHADTAASQALATLGHLTSDDSSEDIREACRFLRSIIDSDSMSSRAASREREAKSHAERADNAQRLLEVLLDLLDEHDVLLGEALWKKLDEAGLHRLAERDAPAIIEHPAKSPISWRERRLHDPFVAALINMSATDEQAADFFAAENRRLRDENARLIEAKAPVSVVLGWK